MVRICTVGDGKAKTLGILPGDELLSINGEEIRDVLDYRFYMTEKHITLRLVRNGKEFSLSVEKGEYEDIDLGFETPLMDKKKTCRNKCVFCFVDQMPKGMRETLYFKDDDERLSFLHGNYITLTNLTDRDIDRIIRMRLSPINISVHTTNPELRVRMMKNPSAGEVLKYIPRLTEAGISVNAQIVLCRDINDGEELKNTLATLAKYTPGILSVSVVPVGLTDHRDGLESLKSFDTESAGKVISTVECAARKMLALTGSRVFFPSDEFFLAAGIPLPAEEYYEDYPQLENGVGMLTLFRSEAEAELDAIAKSGSYPTRPRKISVCTAALAYPTIKSIVEKIKELCYNISCDVFCVQNDVFGHNITVSGLLCGCDIAKQLSGKDLGSTLYFPPNCLRHPECDFLCGMTPEQLSAQLSVQALPSGEGGDGFVRSIIIGE